MTGPNWLGVRTAVPEPLDLFAAYEIAATWATAEMLMAESREERNRLCPVSTPSSVALGHDS